jgi:hypothetical protein
MNQNVDKLNNLLYGYQDYAIIAARPAHDRSLQESTAENDG